jgi:hypothetical protein
MRGVGPEGSSPLAPTITSSSGGDAADPLRPAADDVCEPEEVGFFGAFACMVLMRIGL